MNGCMQESIERAAPDSLVPDVPLAPDFLVRLAHEIRAPLNVVSGVLAELHADRTGDRRGLLDLASRSARRLGRLAERIDMVRSLQEGEANADAPAGTGF